MFPRQMDINVAIDGFRLAASVPLTPLEQAWNALVQRNALSRARDARPQLNDWVRVRVRCIDPKCWAPIYNLTVVARENGPMRACRKCGSEFPVGS